jgi:hypothetical protein
MRDTYTKKSDKEIVHTTEFLIGKDWTKSDEETCKK